MSDYERGVRDAIEFLTSHTVRGDVSHGEPRTDNGHYRLSVVAFDKAKLTNEMETANKLLIEAALAALVTEAAA